MHAGLLGAQHCDARVWDSNGVEHSLSAGPDPSEPGHLNAWDTTAAGQGGKPLAPFTGDIEYFDAQANCDTVDGLIWLTHVFNHSPHPKYSWYWGPNSNTWLDDTFAAEGIHLNLNLWGPPIFQIPYWRGKP